MLADELRHSPWLGQQIEARLLLLAILRTLYEAGHVLYFSTNIRSAQRCLLQLGPVLTFSEVSEARTWTHYFSTELIRPRQFVQHGLPSVSSKSPIWCFGCGLSLSFSLGAVIRLIKAPGDVIAQFRRSTVSGSIFDFKPEA